MTKFAPPAVPLQAPELLPCPFCGSLALGLGPFNYSCVRCGAEGPDADNAITAEVAEAWNRRVASPSAPAADAALPLPKLPVPAYTVFVKTGIADVGDYYTADDMREYARAALALPQAAPITQARMLTGEERRDVARDMDPAHTTWLQSDWPCARLFAAAVIRKFCEINRLTLDAALSSTPHGTTKEAP